MAEDKKIVRKTAEHLTKNVQPLSHDNMFYLLSIKRFC